MTGAPLPYGSTKKPADPMLPAWRETWDASTRELVREESVNGRWKVVSRKFILAENRK